MMPPISNGRWDNDAPRRSAGRHAIVPGPVRHRRAVSGVPVQGPLAGRFPLRCLRARRCLRAQDQDRLRVRGLPQAALAPGRHHLRADQDGLGQVVPGDPPGDVQQGRDRRHRARAAAGPGQLPDRLDLAAQAPQGHGPPGSSAPGRARRGRRDPRRRPAARQARPGRRRQDPGRRGGRGRPRRGPRPPPPPAPAPPPGGPRLPPRAAASAGSLDAFLAAHVAKPATVTTDGWRGYLGLPAKGYDHEPINLGATWGDAALRLPAIHLVFSLVERWLLGTHHGAVGEKHLPAYLDECAFRFNRRTAKRISHGFARLVEHAVRIEPTSYRDLVAPPAPARRSWIGSFPFYHLRPRGAAGTTVWPSQGDNGRIWVSLAVLRSIASAALVG